MSNYGKMSLADKQLLTAVDQLIDSLLSANPCNPSEIYSSKDYSWEDIKERGAVIGGVFQYKLNEQDMLFVKIQCVYDLKPEGFNFTTPTNFKYRANIWCVLDETPINDRGKLGIYNLTIEKLTDKLYTVLEYLLELPEVRGNKDCVAKIKELQSLIQ